MSKADEEKERALCEYLWRYHREVFTDVERKVWGTWVARMKLSPSGDEHPETRAYMEGELAKYGNLDNAEINRALKIGMEAFQREATRRVVAHPCRVRSDARDFLPEAALSGFLSWYGGRT